MSWLYPNIAVLSTAYFRLHHYVLERESSKQNPLNIVIWKPTTELGKYLENQFV